MDWSYYVEGLWRASIPLELVPDLFAWGICLAIALKVLHFVVVWRPRTCATGAAAWLGWFGWQVCFVHGYAALEAAEFRFWIALEVTDRCTQDLLAAVRAWVDFFLPFLSDVCKWVLSIWRRLTLHQRLALIGAILSAYATMEAVRIFRKHKSAVQKVLFHASFLVGGPLIWHLCGIVPLDWLPCLLSQTITTVPTVMSLAVLSGGPSVPSAPRWASQPAHGGEAAAAKIAKHKLWLSYWACWPALALLEAVVGMVPRLAPNFMTEHQLHADLQKAVLTFVIWLQYWQGSRVFNFTLRSLLNQMSILDLLASIFGQRGFQILNLARGGVSVTGAASVGGFKLLTRLTRRLWLFVLAAVVGSIGLAFVVYVFYSAVSLLSSVATALLWCFAAMDAADTLSHNAEEFYSRKLAFWVLAMLWGMITELPYVGVVLRLFTPFAFAMWLVAGETVLRYVILPSLRCAKEPLLMLRAKAISAGQMIMPAKAGSFEEAESSGREEEDEDLFGVLAGKPGDGSEHDGASPTAGVLAAQQALPEGLRSAACSGDTGGAGDIDEVGASGGAKGADRGGAGSGSSAGTGGASEGEKGFAGEGADGGTELLPTEVPAGQPAALPVATEAAVDVPASAPEAAAVGVGCKSSASSRNAAGLRSRPKGARFP